MDDLGILNWREHPTLLKSAYGMIFLCGEQGWDVNGFMTATEAHYWAMKSEAFSSSPYSSLNPFKYYKRSSTEGLRVNHRAEYDDFKSEAYNADDGCGVSINTPYDGDEQALIDYLDSALPGLGKDRVKSIEYQKDKEYKAEDYQGALFALSSMPRYNTSNTPLQHVEGSLPQEQKELGYFDIDEIQGALWNHNLGVNIGGDNISFDGEGNEKWIINDRNLGRIAEYYQNFYKTIHSLPKGYEDIVEAHAIDKNEQIITENVDDYIETTETEINGERYKTYKYKDSTLEADIQNKCYVLGPYCIDYSVDDQNLDIYHSTPTNDVKFNSIEKITVYNQNKVDIEDLGGSFKIAYKYDGDLKPEDEGKVHRISDQYYYEMADYQEISGFQSLKPFYIVVYRGTMQPKDFTGFYAKIDFQYLDNVTGYLASYYGQVIHYYYTKDDGGPYTANYSASIHTNPRLIWISYDDGDDEGSEWVHTHTNSNFSKSYNIQTYQYTLHREESSEHAQRMTAYGCNGERHYKKYSIILTSSWEHEESPRIELYKECQNTGDSLYGAKFRVTLDIEGENFKQEEINKTIKFSRVTNTRGLFRITTSEIESRGVYLGTFTGTIYVEFEEIKAPAGHEIIDDVSDMTIELEDGKIVDVSGSGDTEIDERTNTARITVENDEGGTPKIQIAKVNAQNNLIEEACFEIHVAYTDPNSGRLIDVKSNIIRGQTNGGYLNLTTEDFENMDDGFSLEGYTGKVTLRLVEVGVVGTEGYSISSDDIIITLKYKGGELVEYDGSDADAVVHYLYDKPMTNIYKWAKGEGTLYNYVEDKVNAWVKAQEDKTGLKYEDVLAKLAEYIDEHPDEFAKEMEEWDTSTITSTVGHDVVQIVVEDTPGEYHLPELETKPEPFFMEIAGTVFLDQTVTKEHENEHDGKLGQDEELLRGIEVALYEEDGTLATLQQNDGDIRTNPTITDENGYYEFRGVDALKRYYVVFRYNGMEYTVTDSDEAQYNTDEWAVSSKGKEMTSNRSQFNLISANSEVYDYYEIQGIYTEIANYTLEYMTNNKTYPDWGEITSYVSSNHSDDRLIDSKLDYIKRVEEEARAGYSSKDSSGLYPHESLGENFLINDEAENATEKPVKFAGSNLNVVYPGQKQINLGLVERDSTDLELLTDVVNTRVSMNRYDTTYDYLKGEASYHQYIYEEDYNYATSPRTDGIAYYTEDNVHFYITYEATITNSTLTPTSLVEIVDYYDKEFTWKDEYTTTAGNKIKGFEAWYNDTEISGTVSNTGRYASSITRANTSSGDYKANYVTLNGRNTLTDGDTLRIRLTYELVGTAEDAKEVLNKYLRQDAEGEEYSKTWEIGHYTEITAYETDGAYIDSDSHPGNFNIVEFEEAKDKYQEAYVDYILGGLTEDGARKVKKAMLDLDIAREDDAWKIGMVLSNSGYIRTINGNAWEAIDDKVKSSLDLQSEYGTRYVTWNGDKNLALGGIKVELVELLKNGDTENGANQIVRGVTTTDENGAYTFKSFIPGDYTVRFVYGDYADTSETIYSKVTTNTYENKDEADKLPINGQYYQSTKANPETDLEKYWYSEKVYDDMGTIESPHPRIRYSDAYDDVYSRLTQMRSKIENAENSTSSEYDYDGELEVETTRHTDPVYAYTSTMEIEVEYIRPRTNGNLDNSWYEYVINNIDFGLTPRSYNDVNISDYVSNIKLYKEGETKPLINVYFDEAGNKVDKEDTVGNEYVKSSLYSEQTLRDVIDIQYEELAQNRSHLEITYGIKVSNDSLYDAQNNVYDTIKYIFKDGKEVAVVYYNEDKDKLVAYEGAGRGNDTILYHNDIGNYGYSEGLRGENRNQENNENTRLAKYNEVTGYNEGTRNIITSRATNIIDFPNQPLDFTQKNYLEEDVNKYWTSAKTSDYVSSRELYSIANGEITWSGKVENENSLITRSHIIRAIGSEPDDELTSPLFTELKPGETCYDELVLQHTLLTSQTDITGDPSTTDLTGDDDEYSNLIELNRLANIAGKITDIEGYDITGEIDKETSRVRNSGDVDGEDPIYTPTISTGKSEIVQIGMATGLTAIENAVHSNLGIVLIALVVLAIGIILLKKFVIDSKGNSEEKKE